MAEYINKKTAISLIKQYGHDAIDGGRYSLDTVDDCIELENRIEALPTEDVAPVVHGRWDENGYCVNCGRHAPSWSIFSCYCKTNYCPNCGAKMDGGGENGSICP